ncbi:MAG: CapA family protein [Paenibacillus sp.]|jgi:poly-gamma-glutamate synthesis protein (capsule biosynthesis protein)|nr:CapA family protein [Paenibacillus sp.]
MTTAWSNGTWQFGNKEPQHEKETIRLTLGSDWLPQRAYELKSGDDPLAYYGDLLPLLRQSDLNIVNVETTLGSAGEAIPKAGPNFRCDEDTVRALTEAPFQVACMANNHIMDYGPDSLRRTLEVLQEAGMNTVGAGMTGEEAAKPLFVQVGDQSIAIINFAEGEACCSIDNGPGTYGFDPEAVERQVAELKNQADHVLVIFHGGREYAPLPPEYVVSGLRRVAEAGASAVIAHHPHVPQGLEIWNGVPIVYSQGNFVFWQEVDSFYRHTGYLVHLELRKAGVAKLELSPYVIERHGLSLMQGSLKAGFLQALRTVSELLADPSAVRAVWEAFVDDVGLNGMARTVQSTLKELETNPEAGAARLHNLFFAPAHRELFLNGLKRASYGNLGNSPQWAKTLVKHWQSCRYEEGKQLCEASAPGTSYLEQLLHGTG